MVNVYAPADNPYASSIENFFIQEFPQIAPANTEATLEVLTAAFTANSQIRYGPLPNPESLVAIRSVIRNAMEAGKPIPVLVPYGSRKARLGEKLDVAELASLKMLACLEDRVLERYPPGIQANIRIEDASGHYLFARDGEQSRKDTLLYCDTLVKLVHILSYGFIHPKLESRMFDELEFARAADEIVPLLMEYITDTDDFGMQNATSLNSFEKLQALGWKGIIPPAQRDYYRERYKVSYPGLSQREATVMMARYFAAANMRYRFNAVGNDPDWKEWIQVTFVPPVPGAPMSMVARNIYYRTLPAKMANTHLPPWRGKGYLRLDGNVLPKLASWNEPREYQPYSVEFSDGDECVSVQADYILED